MVTVDDATYVKMRDTLYGGDAAKASKYKSLIESKYTDEQYNNFVSNLDKFINKQSSSTPKSTTTSTPAKQTVAQPETTTPTQTATPVNQQETVGSTVPEIKQEGALKPLSQDYYNQTSSEAQNQIVSNLNNYRQTNPEFFKDYESFKKNFSYDMRNEEQKNTLDTRYGGYQKGMQLAGLPTTDLYTQYKDGQVSAAELENLRVYDPTKYAELQSQINKGNVVAAYDDDKGIDTTGMSIQDMAYQMAVQTFNQFLNGDTSSGASNIFREYEDKMNDPEMLGLSDKTTEIQEEIENIQADLDSIKKSVEEEYAGTGASRSKIKAIIADRSYDLQLQLRTLNSEYNKYATQYNNRMQQYQTEFSMQLQEYQINQQERNQKMNELGFAMDMMNFETNEQKAQREWEYWVKQQEYTNGNINSKDYQTRYKAALKSVENLLAQYPNIPMQRSAEQMAQDILAAIDGGSDLGTELTKINKLIQEKPEYKYMYNQTFKPASSQGFGGSVNIGGQEYVEYNGKLYTAEEFNKKFGGGNGKAKEYTPITKEQLKTGKNTFFNNFDSKYKNGYGGQCGKFVNDYLQTVGVGRYYDDDLDTKLNSVNTQVATVGSIAIFDYGHKSSDGINHGHVGIVTDILPDGRIQILDSNYGSDGKIQERLIEPGSASLKGFFDPTIGSVVSTESPSSNKSTTSATNTTTISSTSNTIGNMTSTQFDNYVKQYINGEVTYSEIKAAFGDEGLKKVTERAAQLKEGGYEKSTQLTDPNKIATMESKLRSEYDKSVSDLKETQDWVNKMQEAYSKIDTDKNAASQAIVIAYNKILDPGSVVREGEYARTADGQSVLSQIQAKLEKLSKGGAGLTKKELKSLIDVASKFAENSKTKQIEKAKQIKVSIDKYGLTPEAILPTDIVDELYGTNKSSQSTQTNFYQKYANTAPGYQNTPVYDKNGQRVGRKLFSN